LSGDVNETLLERSGPYGPTVSLVESFEREIWHAVSRWCHIPGVPPDVVSEAFVDALVWAARRVRSYHA
jgi:c-di-GMP-related signal transduction protein